MNGFKLKLTQRDLAGNPLIDGNGKPLPMIAGMRFMKVLPVTRSLFHFKFDPGDNHPPLDFYMDSDNASEFFGYLDDVIAAGPNPASPVPGIRPLDTADANGDNSGTLALQIVLNATGISFSSYPLNVNVCTFSLLTSSGSAVSFTLANTDTEAVFGFMDNMLWTNPPSPPH